MATEIEVTFAKSQSLPDTVPEGRLQLVDESAGATEVEAYVGTQNGTKKITDKQALKLSKTVLLYRNLPKTGLPTPKIPARPRRSHSSSKELRPATVSPELTQSKSRLSLSCKRSAGTW